MLSFAIPCFHFNGFANLFDVRSIAAYSLPNDVNAVLLNDVSYETLILLPLRASSGARGGTVVLEIVWC